jgi:hypothetical protein
MTAILMRALLDTSSRASLPSKYRIDTTNQSIQEAAIMKKGTFDQTQSLQSGYVRKPDLHDRNMRWLRTCENRVDTLFAGDKT